MLLSWEVESSNLDAFLADLLWKNRHFFLHLVERANHFQEVGTFFKTLLETCSHFQFSREDGRATFEASGMIATPDRERLSF